MYSWFCIERITRRVVYISDFSVEILNASVSEATNVSEDALQNWVLFFSVGRYSMFGIAKQAAKFGRLLIIRLTVYICHRTSKGHRPNSSRDRHPFHWALDDSQADSEYAMLRICPLQQLTQTIRSMPSFWIWIWSWIGPVHKHCDAPAACMPAMTRQLSSQCWQYTTRTSLHRHSDPTANSTVIRA